MTDHLDIRFANELLNRLEDRELPLLSWGVTESALSEAEVLETIDDVLSSHEAAPAGVSAQAVLEEFLLRALLFEVPVPVASPPRYRTRLAESVRLTAGLRQLFARGGWADEEQPGWWQHRPRLVADYRLHVSPRRYPRRNIPAEDALLQLAQLPSWGEVQARVAAAQLQGRKLARFQLEATRTVFASLSAQTTRGIIVGAGTGSGKTLAFYLPAFAAMADHARHGAARVHTLALYPRKELLRDQLRESIRAADSVDQALHEHGRRSLRVGALYGDTPWNTRDRRLEADSRLPTSWERTRKGVVCPYLPCPNPDCGTGDLEWTDDDRRQGRERLTCIKCGYALKQGRLALTRDSMRKNPPDLLFTTTEMLNRASGDYHLERLLGWRGGTSTPSLVLLDEVHTYSGFHGAQVALLLRRWREAVRRPITFVGLSATLRDADTFFAQLVGLHPGDVVPIEPDDTDMESEGREYALALRGDPVSGASLLSTSIQTAMLHGRLLDLDHNRYLYGSTGFLFTDDLDVTNRFYNDLRDAEGGQDRAGRRHNPNKVVLAGLRSSTRDEHAARYLDGQSWDLAEKIGHDLDPTLRLHHLRVGRTSSQDVGVDHDANLTVATASLEVGFNDPRVGLALQHKAPRDPAAFIQRRGRAGRQRGTRPITIVTLSDYGRDRLAYQAYETLFAPEVPARNLPINNRFVLKIQATQALLDWSSSKLRTRKMYDDPRKLLKAPNGYVVRDEDRDGHNTLASLFEALLCNPDLQDELARHLMRALKITADEVQALLWEQPRSLLLAVVPTALRRLRSNWTFQRTDPGAKEGSVLPEFITRSLFEPLNLPEVALILPFPEKVSLEQLPIARALREAVPGRVSRRFGHRRDEHRTWLPIPPSGVNALPLPQIVQHADPEGVWHPHGYDPQGIKVFRPHQLKLEQPTSDIADHSQGFPLWGTQIVVPEDAPPTRADVPHPSPWHDRIRAIGFATHAAGNPIEIRRMTIGAECNIAFARGGGETRTVHYELHGKPAALGFRMDVDAARILLNPINTSDPHVKQYLSSPQWRSLAFSCAINEDPALADISNRFQREWLTQVYLTAFALEGMDGTRTAQQVRESLANGKWARQLTRIISVLYRDNSDPEQILDNARLITGLTELVHDERVLAAVDRAAELLVAPDVADRTEDLAQRAYRDTLAAAILAAAQRACPDAQDGDLIVDVLPGTDSTEPTVVWLSETSVGGLGVIESLVRFYGDDPRRFWALVTSTLAPSDYEYVDATLTRLLRHLAEEPGGDAATAIRALRGAEDAEAAKEALNSLLAAWERLDGRPRRAAVSALSTRLLRPGSGPDTDAQALSMVNAWVDLESRLGVEVDARVIAYAVGDRRLSVGGSRALNADQAFSLLWPRGRQARTQDLQHYQPYAEAPVLDRLLVRTAPDDRLPQVDVTSSDWILAYQKAMSDSASVELICPASEPQALAEAIVQVPALRIDRDVLVLYGEVRGYARHPDELRVRVELREAAQ